MDDIKSTRKIYGRKPVVIRNRSVFGAGEPLPVSGGNSYNQNAAQNTVHEPNRGFIEKTFFSIPLLIRVGVGVCILLILAEIVFPAINAKQTMDKYNLSDVETTILSTPVYPYADKLVYNQSTQKYIYNAGYKPGGEVSGDSYAPKVGAEFGNKDQGITVSDPVNNVGLTLKPKFKVEDPQKNANRMVYPVSNMNATKVYTLKASGVKEDIIVHKFQGDKLEFKYDLVLPEGTVARMEADGSIGVYGVASTLLGNVSTGSDKDAEILKKARQNGQKDQLIFKIPKPVILEKNKKTSSANARYSLSNNELSINAEGLSTASYPLSIDPSVYVETAAKLMRGNNETNTDFDVDNELIQKSQTTGARIDAWQGNLDMSEGTWGQGTAAAGGYVYRAGGETGLYTKPQIVDQSSSSQSSDSTSFVMNMPNTRQAGDLYIAMMCHDGTGAVTAPGGGGWTEYADTREYAAYYKIGTDAGGGNEASSYTWTGSSEQWYGTIVRVTGFNSSDPISGTPGTGSSASDAIPNFPATTPDNSASLVISSVGADNDIPDDTGWLPRGYTKIDSGNSNSSVKTDTNDCGFAAASLDTSPTDDTSTGTTALLGSSINDTYGASTIAINPSGIQPKPQIQSQTETLQNSDNTNFVMNMPSTRPAGDLYIAVMCFDGSQGDGSGGSTSGNTISTPSGWTKYANRNGHAAYYKIGTDAGGGNEAASYTFTGDSEKWGGVIMRITGFDSSDPISGTAGVGHSNTSATPVFPATTPDNNNTLVIRAVGADNDEPSATAWVPSGHTKIASGGPTGTNDCAYATASLDVPPASGVSTGTATLGDSSINDDYGASSIAINPVPSSAPAPAVRSSVNWAKFNSSTLKIESPNPGTGACSGWCNDPTYDLPSARKAHSVVAYNGYLYVMGGEDSGGSRVSTVYIAKLGANGEPQLWHPTDTNPNNWNYWFVDSGLSSSTAKSYFGAVAYNNRMYVMGGETNASPGGITTVEAADILPNGKLGSWTTTGMQALPSGAGTHMQSIQVYNNTLYTMGGFEGVKTSSANLRSAVYYSRINDDGTMNSWQAASSFATARSNFGGVFSTIWGAYIYLSGGCTAVNGSGYCTTIASDTQVVSINADGSLDEWSDMGIDTKRIGYNLIGWQGGLYRLGGCTEVDTSSGDCITTLADVDYGTVNPAGEVSTVNISTPSGSGDCTGGSPSSCDLPPAGDDAGEIGHMLNITVVLNGYLYVIGGCAEYNCNDGGNSPSNDNISSNTAYVAIDSDGTLIPPPSCSGTSYGAWCVDNTNLINGADGVAAAGVTVFNNRIYVIGGIDSTAATTGELYYNSVNPTNGSLSGTWSTQTLSSVGISENIFYTYANARANPSQAGTYDGNLFIFGGCGNGGSGAGCGNSDYETEVYKCWIEDTGEIETTADSATYDCTTSGQLQIDSTPGSGNTDGLGIHSGTVYANYIYLIGGYSQAEADKDDVIYAKFDDNNNVVAVTGSDWIESSDKLSVGRRRGWAFGYNGHIYSVGGYDDGGSGVGGVIPFIEWSKINVSDGDTDPFVTSSVTITQRWGLSMVVSNSYAYVIGGCDSGASPSSCNSFEPSVQTFQLYNNNSGSVNDFTAQGDQDFATDTDRIGAASAIYNGRLYVAGGCTNIGCTTVSDNVQYTDLSAADGSQTGNWTSTTDSTLPQQRAWGSLEVANNTLYYTGGQDNGADEKSDVYYGVISGGNVAAWTLSSNGLPGDRTQHGSAVWNNRLYVVGGLNDSAAVQSTVYVSPTLTNGDIGSAWSSTTAFNVARTGAAVTAYANNLYIFGGFDGTNYLSDVQYTQINSDGTLDSWHYTKSLPGPLRDSRAVAANGYIYLVGGRSASTTCTPKILITPISANTTIASGNNPTGVGEWYETNVRYTGDRYGAAVAYDKGKIYTMGGGCSSILSSNRHYQSTVNSQPQVAIYSRLIDTDTDVFPNSWLLNGLDNSIGARWQVRYRTMNDTDGVATDCGTADMTTWGQDTDFGETTLGNVNLYTPKDGSGTNINCARYFYFFIDIDASKTFGYPEDVNRGPTISDLSLFFTSDPSKRLRHGKTFTGGEQQPLDTPCRRGSAVSGDPNYNCPLP